MNAPPFSMMTALRVPPRLLAHVEQQLDLGELSRQQHMVGIRHLGTYGESSRLRVYLRVGEIHQSS